MSLLLGHALAALVVHCEVWGRCLKRLNLAQAVVTQQTLRDLSMLAAPLRVTCNGGARILVNHDWITLPAFIDVWEDIKCKLEYEL